MRSFEAPAGERLDVAIAQALFPQWAHHPSTAGLRVHLANGLYMNALLDRAIGGFRITRSN